MDDSVIIKEILQGDKDKFRLLIEKYQEMVFRTVMGFVHNKEDADDLTQEIFIQVYQSLERFKGNSAFSTWLYRIAINASLNKIRRSPLKIIFQRFDATPDEKKNQGPAKDSGEDPEDILIRQEQAEWVKRALDTLPENQRTAIVLSKYDDLPQKEIAQIMNISEGAVESLLQRAKNNLRKKLSAHIIKKS
jgi:RNA polymerase sigma-70 factor (ECF subfamily)